MTAPVHTLRRKQHVRILGAVYRVMRSEATGRRNGWLLRLSGGGNRSDIVVPSDATVEIVPKGGKR